MNKKRVFPFILKLTLGILIINIGIGIAYQTGRFDEGYPQEGDAYQDYYKIDPTTILFQLNQGKKDVFLKLPEESEEFTKAPPESFSWGEADFLKIASALHQFVWGEPLESWHLYWAKYKVFQCQNDLDGFETAYYLYYKQQNDRYIVHPMYIQPLASRVITGNEQPYFFTGKWKNINPDQIMIGADDALKIAEVNGGKQARQEMNNDCHVDVYLIPDAFQLNFLICPFCFRDWGWEVTYWPIRFEVVIDPFTGKSY